MARNYPLFRKRRKSFSHHNPSKPGNRTVNWRIAKGREFFLDRFKTLDDRTAEFVRDFAILVLIKLVRKATKLDNLCNRGNIWLSNQKAIFTKYLLQQTSE
jgi:hypothetical protein